MQRNGNDGQKGLVFVLNNAARWNGRLIDTQWANTRFIPLAWWGRDNADVPEEKWTDGTGTAEFFGRHPGAMWYMAR